MSFMSALAKCEISFEQASAPQGEFVCQHCPAANMVPGGCRLLQKQLIKIFSRHMEGICNVVKGSKLRFVLNESPEILGYPIVNTLVCLYSADDPCLPRVRFACETVQCVHCGQRALWCFNVACYSLE